MATRSFTAIFAVVSAAVTVVIATTGCAWLLFSGPCGMYGCPPEVSSLPPRDNPLARALDRPVKSTDVLARLNNVVAAQIGAPPSSPCEEAAAPGRRYTLLLQEREMSASGKAGRTRCYLMEVAVTEGPGTACRLTGPVYRDTPCPPSPPPG